METTFKKKIKFAEKTIPPRCRKPRAILCEKEFTIDLSPMVVDAFYAPACCILTGENGEVATFRSYQGQWYLPRGHENEAGYDNAIIPGRYYWDRFEDIAGEIALDIERNSLWLFDYTGKSIGDLMEWPCHWKYDKELGPVTQETVDGMVESHVERAILIDGEWWTGCDVPHIEFLCGDYGEKRIAISNRSHSPYFRFPAGRLTQFKQMQEAFSHLGAIETAYWTIGYLDGSQIGEDVYLTQIECRLEDCMKTVEASLERLEEAKRKVESAQKELDSAYEDLAKHNNARDRYKADGIYRLY